MTRRMIGAAALLLLVFVGIALAGFGLVGASRAPRAYSPQGPGDLYLALGDSLAWGFRLDDPASESYPALIHAALGAAGSIELTNVAVPGETSASLQGRQLRQALELIAAKRRDGLRVSPITLDVGGNDLRSVERASPTERAEAVAQARLNIAQTLDELRRAAGSEADIAIMTYYNPYEGDPAVENSDAYWVEQLNSAIRAEAASRGVAVAEVYPLFVGGRAYTHTFVLLGDIHANGQGHRLIADEFLRALGYELPAVP